MKSYLIVLGLTLVTSLAFAQNSSIGPSVGINSAWISDSDGEGGDVRNLIGLNAGLNYLYSKYVHFGLGAGVGFSREGVIVKSRGVDTKATLDYIRVPLKIHYFFNHLEDAFRPKVYVGPSLGFLLGGKVKTGDVSVDVKDFRESFDAGLLVGTGFNYKFASRSWFTFDLNYTHGLISINKTGTDQFNRNVGVTMGLAYGF